MNLKTQELHSIKQTHEASLRVAQRQLAELNSARTRLNAVLLERNQVIDFLAEHAKNSKLQRQKTNNSIQHEKR